MKTTIELPDSLLAEAKALARARKTTLRRIIEDSLRNTIVRERKPARPFKLRDGSQNLGGFLDNKNWQEIRQIIYEGRGE